MIRLVGFRGGFDANLGIVGQTVGSGCDYAIAFREAIENLHLIALPDSGLHRLLVGAIVGAGNHHIAASVRSCEDGRRWNHHRVRHAARQHGNLHARSRPQPSFRILRLYPDFDGRAVGIKRRADDGHFPFDRIVFAGSLVA